MLSTWTAEDTSRTLPQESDLRTFSGHFNSYSNASSYTVMTIICVKKGEGFIAYSEGLNLFFK